MKNQYFATYQDAQNFVNRFTKGGKPVHNLDRFAQLMAILGNPQEKLCCVHIAGTNGKGSVGRYLGEIFMQSGLKTGEYSSPFIENYRDRIRINNEWIDESKMKENAIEVAKALEIWASKQQENVDYLSEFSQFEITTAIAMLHFMKEMCDIVCMEVGIGGLLDATNIISNPLISVITHISLDHTDIIGNSVEKIALQKAGIIKPNCPVVISANAEESVYTIFKKVADNFKSPVIIPDTTKLSGVELNALGGRFLYLYDNMEADNIFWEISMPGMHQVENALIAIEVVRSINRFKPLNLAKLKEFTFNVDSVQKGLKNAKTPLRLEIFSSTDVLPEVILDGAHNPGGMKAFAEFFNYMPDVCGETWIILGMLSNKKWEQSIEKLLSKCSKFMKYIDKVLCVDDFFPGCVNAKKISELIEKHKIKTECVSFKSRENIEKILQHSLEQLGASGRLISIGSLYLGSSVREIVKIIENK